MEINDESKFDEIIGNMQEELSPPTLQEFELGMALACLMDAIVNPDDWRDDAVDSMLDKADSLLEVWLYKYESMMNEYNNLGE